MPKRFDTRPSHSWLALLPLVLLASAGLTGCLQTREDQKELEERQVVHHQLSTLQQSTATADQRFQDLEDETRKLNGRVETIEARQQQLNSKGEKNLAGLEQKNAETDKAYREEFTNLHNEINALKEQISSSQAAATAAAEAAKKQREEQAAAEAARNEQATKNPLATAEDLYDKKQWKDAILSYEKYRSQNPKGKSFALATYRIGVCFQELGMHDDAAAFYEEVISKAPKSKEAEKAQARLKKLKKG